MNIGLVLAGGMAKGAYEIGALRALQNYIPFDRIKCVSSSSVGVLNAYAFVTGKLQQAEEMWENICVDNVRFPISKLLRSSLLQQNIRNLYNDTDSISTPFYCTLLETNGMRAVYKNLSTVKSSQYVDYLRASVSMPIYNRAVRIGPASYFDGAMIDNIPVYPLLKHNLDYIICIYFDELSYKFEDTYFDNKVIRLVFSGGDPLKQSLVVDKQSVRRMIKLGESKTEQILSAVFANGYDDLDHIYATIENSNRNVNRTLRVTGDVLVTNLNKITQKIAKRKIIF